MTRSAMWPDPEVHPVMPPGTAGKVACKVNPAGLPVLST
jgi:hypothetical protein